MLPMRLISACAVASALSLVASALDQKPVPPAIRFASDRLVSLTSPDSQWTLANGCHGCPAGRVLWLANNGDHHRRIVRKYENTLVAAWSPDSANFFVNDEPEDGSTRAYVTKAESLEVSEIERWIVAADPDAPKFLRASRAAIAAERWLASDKLSVALTGRYDEPTPVAFEIRYVVRLDGKVERISSRQWDADSDPPPH